MGQMAIYCQNLTIGALSGHNTLSVLVGVLFKKFGLFLNTPSIFSAMENNDSLNVSKCWNSFTKVHCITVM
jgi:hypothetical protein